MTLTIFDVEMAERLFPQYTRYLNSALSKLYSGNYNLSEEEKKALALVYAVRSPIAYKIDIAKKAHIGNPFREKTADIPGVDTPDKHSRELYKWAMRMLRSKTQLPLPPYFRQQKKPRTKTLEELARTILWMRGLVSEAKKAENVFAELFFKPNVSIHKIAGFVKYLARLYNRLAEAREEARKDYTELIRAGVNPEIKIPGAAVGAVYAKTELERLERDLDTLAGRILRIIMFVARELGDRLASRVKEYEGYKHGLKLAEVLREYQERLRRAKTPEEYANAVEWLLGAMEVIEEAWYSRSVEARKEVGTAVRIEEKPRAERRRGWSGEEQKLAEYLWESIPKKYRGKWNYIQLLHLARKILSLAGEKGVDPSSIDWAHQIDWSLGYRAALARVEAILGSKHKIGEKEVQRYTEYMEKLAQAAPQPHQLYEETMPQQWEIRAWEQALIPA